MAWTINFVVSLDRTLTAMLSGYTATMESKLDSVLAKLESMMTALSDQLDAITADVAEETTTIAGLATFIQGLRDQIAAAGLTPADQAKVEAILAGVDANKTALAAALTANVPPVEPAV